MKKLLNYIVIITIFSSCSAYEMAVNDDLKNLADVYPVKGRQGILIGQKMSFGNYRVNKIKRGWTSSYNIPFIVKFSGASEKFSFDIQKGDTTYHVSALGTVKVTELNLLNEFFKIPLKNNDVLAGSIAGLNRHWNYYITNAGNSMPKEISEGMVRSDTTVIEIRNVRKLANKQTRFSQLEIHGYEFLYHNKTIGSLELLNKGRVFFSKLNTPEINMILSSVSSVLLLKNDLNEERLNSGLN